MKNELQLRTDYSDGGWVITTQCMFLDQEGCARLIEALKILKPLLRGESVETVSPEKKAEPIQS